MEIQDIFLPEAKINTESLIVASIKAGWIHNLFIHSFVLFYLYSAVLPIKAQDSLQLICRPKVAYKYLKDKYHGNSKNMQKISSKKNRRKTKTKEDKNVVAC